MSFDGRLIWRGEPGYEGARVGRIFNARRPDRFPAAVLEAASEDDVVAGVRLARERGLTVSVRSGGHSWASWSLRDDAILIDLGLMRDMTYDASSGVATAQPAVRGGEELAPFLTEHGRFFPGGHCPTVGIGGFLLQGGQGWNGRKLGWACESVVGLDVVMADGELVHADEHDNADLLWAARGSGPGFFGVVTRFHLRTYPRPAAMTHDTWTFELTETEPLLRWLSDILPSLDPVVEPVIAATRLPRPGGSPVLLLHTTAMCETPEEAERVLAPLAACPLISTAIDHQRGPTTVEEENLAQALQNPRTIATRSIAPGAMRRRGSWRRCWSSAGASCRPSTRSRSGTAGRRADRCRTWRSRYRPTRISRPTRSGRTPPTTSAIGPGWSATRGGSRRSGPASTSATPISRAVPTGSWRRRTSSACSRSAHGGIPTGCSAPT